MQSVAGRRRMRSRPASSPDDDIQPAVLERARRGDADAFSALVRHYDRGLRALAFRLLGAGAAGASGGGAPSGWRRP
jgi:hypothetical protein